MRADAEGGQRNGSGHSRVVDTPSLNRRCQPLFTEFLLLPLDRYQRQVLQAEHYVKVVMPRTGHA